MPGDRKKAGIEKISTEPWTGVPTTEPDPVKPLDNEKRKVEAIDTVPWPPPEPKPPLKVFLSYARRDKEHIEDLRKGLKVLEHIGLIQTWYDGALVAGEKWEERILDQLNHADVIICQLSWDFMASDFCMLTELDTAIRRQEKGEVLLIGYVLTDCLWNSNPKLKKFQILPTDARPLDDDYWNNRKFKYWKAVAEGIQEAVEGLLRRRSAGPSSGRWQR